MAGSLVLVDDALVDHAVDDGHGGFVSVRRCCLVAFFDGTDDILDVRPQLRALAHLVKPGFLGLLGAFAG